MINSHNKLVKFESLSLCLQVEHCVLDKDNIVRPKRKYLSEADRTETLSKLRLQADEQKDHKVFRCEICGPRRSHGFLSEQGLQRHLHKVHNAAGGNWKQQEVCSYCGKTLRYLNPHIKKYHPEHYTQVMWPIYKVYNYVAMYVTLCLGFKLLPFPQ